MIKARAALAAAAWAFATQAAAVEISSVQPRGEVAQARQIVAKFGAAAVRFGDPNARPPFAVSCSDPSAARGQGRWTSDREWVYDFEQDLAPGVRCSVNPVAGFTATDGTSLPASSAWQFSTGGPTVQQLLPGSWQRLEEDQVFIAQFNGAVTEASVAASAWCAIEGLGERVPVRMVEAAQRPALFKAARVDRLAQAQPLRVHALRCARTMSASAKVQVVFGPGLASPGGLTGREEKRFNYQVREPFQASVNCERESANADCLPLRPVTVTFTSPIARSQAERIRLSIGRQDLKPGFDDAGAPDSPVNAVSFKPPFQEQAPFAVELPAGLRDPSGRALANAASFPRKMAMAPMPPLIKFAAAPFGVVERFAEPGTEPMLPVTVRQFGTGTPAAGAPTGRIHALRPQTDAEVILWSRRLAQFNGFQVERGQAQAQTRVPLPQPLGQDDKDWVQARMVSLLTGVNGVRLLDLPKPGSGDARPFEVVGIPLSPGFHVLEVASPMLGQSLLDVRHGPARLMYVRTSALVTNLAVHFKLGRQDSLAWVTTLDKGAAVKGAAVQISDCRGRPVASGTTDASGLLRLSGLSPEPPRCAGVDESRAAYFVSARAAVGGVEDLAFTWSDWTRGIEPWRFNLPTDFAARASRRTHTILDRTLVRAGETVSMKHVLREEISAGLSVPADSTGTMVIQHLGSGQQFPQPLIWRKTATGGRSAESGFSVPVAARLGGYEIMIKTGAQAQVTGEFRVEEFRLPVLEGRIAPADPKPLVSTASLVADVRVGYVAGGPAANLPVRVSAMVRDRGVSFPDYADFSFDAPRAERSPASEESGEERQPDTRVVADKLPLTLDRNGGGRVTLDKLPRSARPQDLVLEATYSDPSGEVQTLRHVAPLWPSAVNVGIKAEGWVSSRQQAAFQVIALDLQGRPATDTPVEVRAVARTVTSNRQRLVGGFYAYDNKVSTRDLGSVCSGRTDSRGLLLCNAMLPEPGEVQLVASARDSAGNAAVAAASVWVTRQGELWFGGQDHDRIDLLPEKRAYQAGETARFQVRMPFRYATALVSVEREGILSARVVALNGANPTVEVPVDARWGPNVFVNVLVLRGRLREVPWYSLFTWGYRSPREWWTAFWYEGRDYVAPTALVDLSKPAFRLGVAEIRVGTEAHRMEVSVRADKDAYPVRGNARITITARLPGGAPAAHAEVAVAAVDQALLELMPNTSWNVLDAMLQRRSWGVQTATAQMEIIGRRHYGRKAVPAGGGGGRSPTRELLDTLLLWNPKVQLDAQGQATLTIPLNDTLSAFRIVAVADAGAGFFGTGQTTIKTAQDLQLISGLPPLVREGDRFRAQLTLRNTTARAMQVDVTPRAALLTLQAQSVAVPAGESREVAWDVDVPVPLAFTRAESLPWEVEARDRISGARDALKISQRVVPAEPLQVQQATIARLNGPFALEVAMPANAAPGRGGIRANLQPTLTDGLPGVRDWFANYPFVCLEQKLSKAIGLQDRRLMASALAQIPTYLDRDGLASYFPPREGISDQGSDVLTSYLLAATHEAALLDPAFAMPEQVLSELERGLVSFVEGRIQRKFWSPQRDLDMRKLAAIEALSRYGRANANMLGSLSLTPAQWPTHTLLDWIAVLGRLQDIPQRDSRMSQALQILRSRLSTQGTQIAFTTERDDQWWWLMAGGDANAARLVLAVMDDPAWRQDMPRLVLGLLGRQRNGAWTTTTANVWGSLAVRRFSQRFETEAITGTTRVSLGAASGTVDWSRMEKPRTGATPANAFNVSSATRAASAADAPGSVLLPWPAAAQKDSATVLHSGSGSPWLTLQSVAAVRRQAPMSAGYRVSKSVAAVEQATPGRWSRGDVVRVTLEVDASADMSWVVVSDPVPAGATILGSGLGRDSAISTAGERAPSRVWPVFEERSNEAFRAYFDYLPKGPVRIEYTLRLNNAGEFSLPATRAEAMYAPEVFGELPNARLQVLMRP